MRHPKTLKRLLAALSCLDMIAITGANRQNEICAMEAKDPEQTQKSVTSNEKQWEDLYRNIEYAHFTYHTVWKDMEKAIKGELSTGKPAGINNTPWTAQIVCKDMQQVVQPTVEETILRIRKTVPVHILNEKLWESQFWNGYRERCWLTLFWDCFPKDYTIWKEIQPKIWIFRVEKVMMMIDVDYIKEQNGELEKYQLEEKTQLEYKEQIQNFLKTQGKKRTIPTSNPPDTAALAIMTKFATCILNILNAKPISPASIPQKSTKQDRRDGVQNSLEVQPASNKNNPKDTTSAMNVLSTHEVEKTATNQKGHTSNSERKTQVNADGCTLVSESQRTESGQVNSLTPETETKKQVNEPNSKSKSTENEGKGDHPLVLGVGVLSSLVLMASLIAAHKFTVPQASKGPKIFEQHLELELEDDLERLQKHDVYEHMLPTAADPEIPL